MRARDDSRRTDLLGMAALSVAWDQTVERWIVRLEAASGRPDEAVTLSFKLSEADALRFAREYLLRPEPTAAA